jgi:hypothetical protein
MTVAMLGENLFVLWIHWCLNPIWGLHITYLVIPNHLTQLYAKVKLTDTYEVKLNIAEQIQNQMHTAETSLKTEDFQLLRL